MFTVMSLFMSEFRIYFILKKKVRFKAQQIEPKQYFFMQGINLGSSDLGETSVSPMKFYSECFFIYALVSEESL